MKLQFNDEKRCIFSCCCWNRGEMQELEEAVTVVVRGPIMQEKMLDGVICQNEVEISSIDALENLWRERAIAMRMASDNGNTHNFYEQLKSIWATGAKAKEIPLR